MNYKIDGGFSQFQRMLADIFGSPYGCGDAEGEVSDLVIDDPWVVCPNCEEVIYLSDCLTHSQPYWDCPACGGIEEGAL